MKKLGLVAFVALSGCMPITRHSNVLDPNGLTPEQRAYLETVKTEALTFDIPKSESDAAWSRVQAFIGQHSSMKIQTVADHVIQTYNPTVSMTQISAWSGGLDIFFRYGYNVTRLHKGDSATFTVECAPGNTTDEPTMILPRGMPIPKEEARAANETAIINGKILARFIRTGELPHPELISK